MDKSPQEQIEAIVQSLELKGLPAAPVVEAIALATSYPDAVSELAVAVMKRFPRGGTFLDAALSYLPQEDWPTLVQQALDVHDKSPDKNLDAVGSVIAYASLQCPLSVHPYLDRIFRSRPNKNSYYERFSWRESNDLHSEFLREVIESTSSSGEARMRAWQNICETRQVKLIEHAISCSKLPGFVPDGWQEEEWVSSPLI